MRMFWLKDKNTELKEANSDFDVDKDNRMTYKGTVLPSRHVPIIMNLVNYENTEIEYKISKFPDGQQTIDIIDPTARYNNNRTVLIKSRLNDFKDLELIICTVSALRNLRYSKIELLVPYFLGSRSDRKFNKQGGIHYLKQVVTPIINNLKLDEVTVIDPHSDVLEALITSFEKKDNVELVGMSLEQIDNEEGAQERVVFLSPDSGAFKKIFDVGDQFGVREIVTCSKHRNIENGNIDYTEVPISKEQTEKSMVVIDDICDGGRTFIEIAKVIREKQKEFGTNGKLYLIVTHGIFSKGFDELNKYFDGIFSTNSYSDLTNEKLTQLDVF